MDEDNLALDADEDRPSRHTIDRGGPQESQHDAKYQTNVTFDIGDLVLILQPGRRSKTSLG